MPHLPDEDEQAPLGADDPSVRALADTLRQLVQAERGAFADTERPPAYLDCAGVK